MIASSSELQSTQQNLPEVVCKSNPRHTQLRGKHITAQPSTYAPGPLRGVMFWGHFCDNAADGRLRCEEDAWTATGNEPRNENMQRSNRGMKMSAS